MDEKTLEVLRIYGRILQRLVAGSIPPTQELDRLETVVQRLDRMKEEFDVSWRAPE